MNLPLSIRRRILTAQPANDAVMFVRPAKAGDICAVDSLRKKYGSELGFVPVAKYEHIVNRTSDRGRNRWMYEWLLVIQDADEITGFVLASLGRNGAKCEQVCVREDARRMERAMRLVDAIEHEAQRRNLPRIRCRVAADIDANFFWKAMGFIPVDCVTSTWMNHHESKSKRQLIVYHKELSCSLFRSNGAEGVA